MTREATSPSPETDPAEELRSAVSELARAEMRLILAENATAVRRSAAATVLLAVGVAALALALAGLAWTAGALLSTWMAPWGAALIVTAVLLVIAVVALGVLVRGHRDDPLVRLLGPESSEAAQALRTEAVAEREEAERRVADAGFAAGEALLGAAAERGVQAAVAVVGRGAGEIVEEVEELADDLIDGVEDVLGIDDPDEVGEDGEDGADADTPGRAVRVVTAPLRLVVAVLEGGLERTRRPRS